MNVLVAPTGDNVDVGANAILIGPIHIGDGAVIGAGAVVVKDVPARTIVAGNPAKVIRYLLPSDLQESMRATG